MIKYNKNAIIVYGVLFGAGGMKKFLIALVVGIQLIGMSSSVYGAAGDLSIPIVFDERMSSSSNVGICRVLAHALESKRLQLRTLKSDLSLPSMEVQFSGFVEKGSLETSGVDDVMSQHLSARLAVYASEREYFDGLCIARRSN